MRTTDVEIHQEIAEQNASAIFELQEITTKLKELIKALENKKNVQ